MEAHGDVGPIEVEGEYLSLVDGSEARAALAFLRDELKAGRLSKVDKTDLILYLIDEVLRLGESVGSPYVAIESEEDATVTKELAEPIVGRARKATWVRACDVLRNASITH